MARPQSDRVKVNIYLPPRTLAALKKIAELKGTSYSELVRQACQEYAVREGRSIIEQRAALEEITK